MIIRTIPDVRPDGDVAGYNVVLELTRDVVIPLDTETWAAYCAHLSDVIVDTEYQWSLVQMLQSIGINDPRHLAEALKDYRQDAPEVSPPVPGIRYSPLVMLNQDIPQLQISADAWSEDGQLASPDAREHLDTMLGVMRSAALDFVLYKQFVELYGMDSSSALAAVGRLGTHLPGNNMDPREEGDDDMLRTL